MTLKTTSAVLGLGVLILGGAASATPRTPAGIRFRVVNAGPHVIHGVYVCPSTKPTWGPNLLTRGPLKPGMKAFFRFSGRCGSYDLRLVADDGIEFLEEELEFCEDDDVVTIGKSVLTRLKQSAIR
jgi:hypothetical protein